MFLQKRAGAAAAAAVPESRPASLDASPPAESSTDSLSHPWLDSNCTEQGASGTVANYIKRCMSGTIAASNGTEDDGTEQASEGEIASGQHQEIPRSPRTGRCQGALHLGN